MAHVKNGWIIYISTGAPWGDGVQFSIKADPTTASNNGSAVVTAPPVNNFWPLHRGDMRAGYGVDSGGVRDSCIATATFTAVFTLGQTFQDRNGNTYTVNGLRQEKFRTRDLK
jgi:hypothetical protein